MTQRDEREKIIGAIEVWQKNRLTSFTPRDILYDFGDQIIAALRTPTDGEAHAEIQRLQDAKRRALAIADERAKENVALLARLERVIKSFDEQRQKYSERADDPKYNECQQEIWASLSNEKADDLRVLNKLFAPEPADTPDEGPDPLGYARGER